MMMIPEPWAHHESMSAEKRAFYEYHSCLMEPWDGPAAIAFTDGVTVGAVLDRNGLRPARYTLTRDGLLVMASETGVLDIAPEEVVLQGPPAARAACCWSTREQGRLIGRRRDQAPDRQRPALRRSGWTRAWWICMDVDVCPQPAQPGVNYIRARRRRLRCASASGPSAIPTRT